MLNFNLLNNKCILYQSPTTPNTIKTINQARQEKGLPKISLAGHLGYITREDAINYDMSNYHGINLDEMTEKCKSQGYLTRQEAIENHPEFFKGEDPDNYIIGCVNGEIVRKKDKAKYFNPLAKHLNEVEKTGSFNVQSSVISFPPAISSQMKGLINQESFLNKMNKMYQTHLKNLGYNLENVNTVICCHTNKDHFHLHIDVWEKDLNPNNNRKYEKWDLDIIEKMKEASVRILNSELGSVKSTKNTLDENLIKSIKEKQIIIPKSIVDGISKEKHKTFGKFENKKLINEMNDFTNNLYYDFGYDKFAKEKFLEDKYIYGEEKALNIQVKNKLRWVRDINNKIVKHVQNGGEVDENLNDTMELITNNSLQTQINHQLKKEYTRQRNNNDYLNNENSEKENKTNKEDDDKLKKQQNGNFLKIGVLWNSNFLNVRPDPLGAFLQGIKQGWREEQFKNVIKNKKKQV